MRLAVFIMLFLWVTIYPTAISSQENTYADSLYLQLHKAGTDKGGCLKSRDSPIFFSFFFAT